MARFVGQLTVVAMVICGCGGKATGTASLSASDSVAPGSPLTGCADIATEYLAVLQTALACDPAAADPCGAQRPLVVSEGSSVHDAKVTGLCWVAGVGYVNPARAASLDQVLLRYQAAGCSVTFCPGPS